jgi:transcriptional regulator with XRE-family HTH domain
MATRSGIDSARRKGIADKVRALRQARQWTQAELARHLDLSQSRLSEIENGGGSFSAEQFLVILKLFNVPASHFAGTATDPRAALQNALARLGAVHLRESAEIVPPEDLEDPKDVIRETLTENSPRLITALAPVLVANIDRINLNQVRAAAVDLGLQDRLAWIVENTLAAIRQVFAEHPPAVWARRYRRAETVLGVFLASIAPARRVRSRAATVDVLDPGIRSARTLQEVTASSSQISRRWRVVTGLRPEDFTDALRAARVGA